MSAPGPVLDTAFTQRGGDPDLAAGEYLDVIEAAINAHPRSQQEALGPSDLGHKCSRRIGYQMLGVEPVNLHQGVAWKPAIGTAVHTWLETVFDAWNVTNDSYAGAERFLVETTVEVGEVNGVPVQGHADLYDRVTATVVDWKVVGNPQLGDYKANGPGQQYRYQAHLYGRGFARAGHPVDTVMIVFLPRADELHKRVVWHEPYDEAVALEALERAEGIHLAVDALGAQALAALPTADAYCHRCPFHRPGSTDLATGCPGDPAAAGHHNPFEGLVA